MDVLLSLPLFPTLLVCMLASLILWLLKKLSPSNGLPPGPPSLPIIGHLHLLIGKLPHQYLHQLSISYGPLIALKFGSVPVVIASSPDIARQMLQTHDLEFAYRPRTTATMQCLFDCTSIASAPYGPYWKLMRQLCVTDLFSKKRLESFLPIKTEEVSILMRSVLEDSQMGRQVPVVQKLYSTTNNTISRIMLGKRYTELAAACQDPSANIISLLTEMMHLLGVFNVGDFIPFLQRMDLQGYVRRMKKVGAKYKTVLQEVIDVRRELRKTDPSSPKDLMDVLLAAAKESQQTTSPITDDNIKAVLVDMYAGGTDTSSITTEWALAELLRHPTSMNKLQTEIDSVVGKDRLVEESDFSNLPYLRAVVKETMRLHPVIPLLQHECGMPCNISGYNIAANTRALINVWAIGRDPNAWQKPLEFWPERFLESNIDLRGHHFQLLPFGAGRRGCPGWQLGLLNVQLMLGCLVQGFNWSLPILSDGSKMEPDMREEFGISVLMAKPLQAMAAPRLPLHLYNTTAP